MQRREKLRNKWTKVEKPVRFIIRSNSLMIAVYTSSMVRLLHDLANKHECQIWLELFCYLRTTSAAFDK